MARLGIVILMLILFEAGATRAQTDSVCRESNGLEDASLLQQHRPDIKVFAVNAEGDSAVVGIKAEDEDDKDESGNPTAWVTVFAVNAVGETVGEAVSMRRGGVVEEAEEEQEQHAEQAQGSRQQQSDEEGAAQVVVSVSPTMLREAMPADVVGAETTAEGEAEGEAESLLQQRLSDFKVGVPPADGVEIIAVASIADREGVTPQNEGVGEVEASGSAVEEKVFAVTAGAVSSMAKSKLETRIESTAEGGSSPTEMKAVAVTAEGDSDFGKDEVDAESKLDMEDEVEAEAKGGISSEVKVVIVTANGEAEINNSVNSTMPESFVLAPSLVVQQSRDEEPVQERHQQRRSPIEPPLFREASPLLALSVPKLNQSEGPNPTLALVNLIEAQERTYDAPMREDLARETSAQHSLARGAQASPSAADYGRAKDPILFQTSASLTKSSGPVVETEELMLPLAHLSQFLQEKASIATAAFAQASSGELTTGLLLGLLLLFIVGMGIAGSMLFVDPPEVKTHSSTAVSRAELDVAATQLLSSDGIGNWTTPHEAAAKSLGLSIGMPGNWTKQPEVFHLSPSPSGLAHWSSTLGDKPVPRQASKRGYTRAAKPCNEAGGNGGLQSPNFGSGKASKAPPADHWGVTVFGSGVVSATSSDAGSVLSSEASVPSALQHYLASAAKPLSQLSLRVTVPMPLRQLEQFAQMRFAEQAVSPPFCGPGRPLAEALGNAMIGAQDLTVPEGQEVLLAVPSLREVSSAIVSSLNCHIADEGGRFLFGVIVDRTPESGGGSGRDLLMERISLVDCETRQVHGSCELCLPCGGDDVKLQASIISRDSSQRAAVTEVRNLRGQRALLVGSPDGIATQLIVQAHPCETGCATVSSLERFFTASVEPGSGPMPGSGSDFFWLRVRSGANVGLIILALLAMDRLSPHGGAEHSANASAAGSRKSLSNPHTSITGPDAGPMYKFNREHVRPSRTSAFAGIATRASSP